MARVRKTLLNVGVHHAPQGTLKATAARCRRWADNINKMTADGIKLPVVWAHDPRALPDTAHDLARLNAGYYDDAQFDPRTGKLDIALDVPGCENDAAGNLVTWTKLSDQPDAPLVKTAIAEVSGHIRNWTDGKGKHWDDSIVHVALTPLPVVAGTGGFTDLAGTVEPPEFYLSLATWKADLATEPAMPKEPYKPVNEEDDPDEPTSPEPPAPATPDLPQVNPASGKFAPAIAALKQLGLHLPDDTNENNLSERIVIACHALEMAEQARAAEAPEPPPSAAPAGAPPGAASAPVVEEGRPVMLSTLADDDALKELFRDQQDRAKADALQRIDKLNGKYPTHELNALRDRVNAYELSLVRDPKVKVLKADWDYDLACVESAVRQSRRPSTKGAKEVPPPFDPTPNETKQQEAGSHLAALAGARTRK